MVKGRVGRETVGFLFPGRRFLTEVTEEPQRGTRKLWGVIGTYVHHLDDDGGLTGVYIFLNVSHYIF